MTFTIPDLKQVSQKAWRKISIQEKTAFFSALITGMVTHAFGIINLMPNQDSIHTTLIHSEDMLYQGRWLQKYFSMLTSSYSMPWLNGCVSILLLAFSVYLIVALFKVKSNFSAVIIAGFVVTFPSIASAYAYLYMADAFMWSMFFSVMAVFVSRKIPKWGFILSIFFICISLAIYQAYVCITISLYISLLFLDNMEKEKSPAQVITRAVRDAVSLALGLALYYIVLQLLLSYKDVTLVGYQNISKLNELNIFNFLPRIVKPLNGFYNYFKNKVFDYYPLPMAICHAGVALFAFIYAVYFFFKQKIYKNVLSSVLFLVLLFLLPVAFFSIALMPVIEIHSLMLLSMCIIYILFVKFSEILSDVAEKINLKRISFWILALLSIAVIYSNFMLANRSYLTLKTKFNQTYAYATKLSTRVESSEDYYDGIPVAFFGYTRIIDSLQTPLVGFSVKYRYLIYKPYRYNSFLREYIGATYTKVSDQKAEEIALTQEFIDMPVYPLEGSIKEIGGILVVKLSND